jgi:hypothetical protein
MEFNKF